MLKKHDMPAAKALKCLALIRFAISILESQNLSNFSQNKHKDAAQLMADLAQLPYDEHAAYALTFVFKETSAIGLARM